MEIEFNEDLHAYSIDGEIATTSVTELLAHQGIAPDYSAVDAEVLDASAKKGKKIHLDLEGVLNKAKYEPTTKAGKAFAEWVANNVESGVAEQVVGLSFNGITIGGTIDVIGIMHDGTLFIGDHKTTSKVNIEYVSWQVSIYDYILRKVGKEGINGKVIEWEGATAFYCFHYNKKNELQVVELDKVPDSEIEKMFFCESNEEQYVRPLLVLDGELQEKFEKAELALQAIEEEKKKAELVCAEFREKIRQLFESQGIRSWESADGRIRVSYVRPTTHNRVDSAKLHSEFPRVYSACLKQVPVKASIRIKIKGEEE